MGKMLCVIFAVILISVNCAIAVEGGTNAGASPAPIFKDSATGIELVYVKGGCYQMGGTFGDAEPEEKPVHEVCVDDFYIGKFEVTQGQWKKVMENNPSKFDNCGDDCPVENVSWNNVQDFIDRLNSRSGGDRYRLPTEAEFEYAQRSGGKSERYSGGNDADSVAWYNANSGFVTHSVGEKSPNGLGIHDMSGNVWEWTNDWYGANYYSISPRDNPKGPDSSNERVKRGGCISGPPTNQRVSRRSGEVPDYHSSSTGFRLVMNP